MCVEIKKRGADAMEKISRGIVKCRYIILIAAFVLLIPAAIQYKMTRINYDVLTYLPKDIETMKGQDIMLNQFGVGSFSLYMVEGMQPKEVSELKTEIEKVPHVESVMWYDSFMDLDIPMDMLPKDIYDAFNNKSDNSTMMVIFYDTGMSADETMDAVTQIRHLSNKQCFISGMTAVVTDTKALTEKEEPIYVAIAVILSMIAMTVTMDSGLIPVFFLLSIGCAILYNLGTNLFLGQISYITQALAAVLQLGVTMDYSIFLWHSYQEQKLSTTDNDEAMAKAIAATFTSVIGSSTTTIAGFMALCAMEFTLGRDLGLVMSKGVLFGLISCVTILPSLILVFDKPIEKTRHKPLLPDFSKISGFMTKHYVAFVIIFVIVWIPAIYGYNHTKVYYNLDKSLPRDLPGVVANQKLEDDFGMSTTHMILFNKDMSAKDKTSMLTKIKNVKGVNNAIGLESVTDASVPQDMIPDTLKNKLQSGNYEMMLITSKYKVATDDVNKQCDTINGIIKEYDPKAMLIGEAPCSKDLITITNHDFNSVNAASIGIIFIIIALVFKSVSLPVILVGVIEFAIFINMGIPYYTNTQLPFIASIVIGTIQLGSTVDYAILMTSRYKVERSSGRSKEEAITISHSTSIQSIIVSALSFFAATFGVGLYSNIDIISSMCNLMARGAIISMLTVIFILPSMFMIFDPLIIRTSQGFTPASLAKLNDRKNRRAERARNRHSNNTAKAE